jgi:hypothetical protein
MEVVEQEEFMLKVPMEHPTQAAVEAVDLLNKAVLLLDQTAAAA